MRRKMLAWSKGQNLWKLGWALRQYARTNPTEVRRYVQLNQTRLSALSRREALKHL
jgi:3-methyladenine DNA glycosylase AlkD